MLGILIEIYAKFNTTIVSDAGNTHNDTERNNRMEKSEDVKSFKLRALDYIRTQTLG